MHPFSADVSSILGFLADQFEDGKQYHSLKTVIGRHCWRLTYWWRVSQLASILWWILRLLKGAYNQRPPKPKYSNTWEVTRMLVYLTKLGSNEGLSLKLLTRKLAILLELVLEHRFQVSPPCQDYPRMG